MIRTSLIILAVFAALAFGTTYVLQSDAVVQVSNSVRVAEAMGGSDTTGYARAVEAIEFKFPQDHGPHPDFKTEWWYYTGNVKNKSGRRFGYQFTIFRIALSPTPAERTSDWATSQMYMAHFALSDLDGGEFYSFERFSRGAQGLAGAQAAPFRVWLEDWQTKDAPGSEPLFPKHLLSASGEDVTINLTLESTKPLVYQGKNGLSQKSSERGNASYYYSMTRIKTDGTITIGDEEFDVFGWSWKDREWSTSALAEGQVGWDWFSLQLSNGEEIMFFQLRNEDISKPPFSKGTVVYKDGQSRQIRNGEVLLEELSIWESPHGSRYPARWRFRVPADSVDIEIRSNLPNQELDVSVRYWEGSVSISGKRGSSSVSGHGYVEMTGYGDK